MAAIAVCVGWRLRWSFLCVSGSTLWVLATSLCVCLTRRSELTPLCGVAAVLLLVTLHVARMLFQPPRGRCCFLVQLLSVIPLCCVFATWSWVADLLVVPKFTPLPSLISLGDVFCPLPSDLLVKNIKRAKKDREHENKNKEMNRGKKIAIKFLFCWTSEAKKSEKDEETIGN